MFTSTSRGSRWDWVAMVALLRSLHLFQYFNNVFLYFSTRFKGISVREVWGSECILLLLLGECLNRNACFVLGRRWGDGGGVAFSSLSTEFMFVVVYEWMYKWVDEKVSVSIYRHIQYYDASFQTKSQSLAFALSIPWLKYIRMSMSVECIGMWTQLILSDALMVGI